MKRIKFFNAIILTLNLVCASSFLYASAMEKTVNVQKTEKSQQYDTSDYTDDVIDPQYEVREKDTQCQYMLNDDLLYTKDKDNDTKKYEDVKTKEIFDKLPAVEFGYSIKKHKKTGKIFYFINGNPIYELQPQRNGVILYTNLINNEKFYSLNGKRLYHKALKDKLYSYLPEPIYPDTIYNNNNFIYPKCPSEQQYYDLCKKSMFFKPITEEAFDKKYNEEYNNYNYMDLEDLVIINNVRNNLSKKNGEDFRFVIEPKAKEKLENLNRLNNQGPYDFAKLERISKNITENIRSSFEDGQGKRVKLSKLVDPQYKTIKFGDICFYCYDGKIKFYRNLVNGRYYDLNGTEQNMGLPRADMNSTYGLYLPLNAPNEVKYKVKEQNNNNFKIFDITNEDGKIWYSLDGNKKFYSVQGNSGYVDLTRHNNINLKNKSKILNGVLINNNTLPENYFDKIKTGGEYAEDPQYEVVNSNGETIYFFEGLPRYAKLDNGGYYNIHNGKVYFKLPIVNSDFYWDKEYEVIKRNNRLYYYVNRLPVCEITQTQIPNSNETLLTYNPILENNLYELPFTGIKGKRGYKVKAFSFNGNGNSYVYYKKLPL